MIGSNKHMQQHAASHTSLNLETIILPVLGEILPFFGVYSSHNIITPH